MATTENLDELREQLEAIRIRQAIKQAEKSLHAAELESTWIGEAQGDFVDRSEALWDGIGMSRFNEYDPTRAPYSMPSDKARGDNYPFWMTEAEHRQIRGIARMLATIDEVAISAIENLVNYCIGEGLKYDVVPKSENPTDDDKAFAKEIMRALDKFLEANNLERQRDREEFLRLHRDGEDFVCLRADRIPEARIVDPAFVTEPNKPRALEDAMRWRGSDLLTWKYGVATTFCNTSKPLYYFVSWYGDSSEVECFRESAIVHAKVNVDCEVKRGLSSFFPCQWTLADSGKLVRNTIRGATIQAAIAYIRQHAPQTTPDGIEAFLASEGTLVPQKKTRGGGDRYLYEKRTTPGLVVDTVSGVQITSGPMGTLRQPVYVDVAQAGTRRTGSRFQMPEYMISGDASNGNYASTLVAEAPFTKAAEAKQLLFCAKRRELCIKALKIMCRFGVLRYSWEEIAARVDVSVDGPSVPVRNRKEEHEIMRGEYEAGARSMESWREDAGLDNALENRRGARPQPQQQPPNLFAESWRAYP